MSDEREGIAWDVVRLAANGAPVNEVIERAFKAKAEITALAYEQCRLISMVDGVIATLAPEIEWTTGWGATDPTRQIDDLVGGRKIITGRSQRVFEIAVEMIDTNGTVTTKVVADQLEQEGYGDNPRDLAVSVGNLLARSDVWAKVAAGQYRYFG